MNKKLYGIMNGDTDPMSWYRESKVVPKTGVNVEIERLVSEIKQEWPALESPNNAAVHDQVDASVRALREILKTIPGPLIKFSIGGHAEGTGYIGPFGESYNVSVYQYIENPEQEPPKDQG